MAVDIQGRQLPRDAQSLLLELLALRFPCLVVGITFVLEVDA